MQRGEAFPSPRRFLRPALFAGLGEDYGGVIRNGPRYPIENPVSLWNFVNLGATLCKKILFIEKHRATQGATEGIILQREQQRIVVPFPISVSISIFPLWSSMTFFHDCHAESGAVLLPYVTKGSKIFRFTSSGISRSGIFKVDLHHSRRLLS